MKAITLLKLTILMVVSISFTKGVNNPNEKKYDAIVYKLQLPDGYKASFENYSGRKLIVE